MQTGKTELERIYNATGARLAAGESVEVKTPRAANIPIFDTALASILATLGIPFRDPAPFTDEYDGNRKVRTWWVSDASPVEQGKPGFHVTEDILGGYYNRERMEKEHPLHPMIPMRDAIDARSYWLEVKFGDKPLPRDGVGFATDSLRAASILKAHNFPPIAFTGRAFVVAPSINGVRAEHVLEIAQRVEGQTAPQWMHKVLVNLDILLAHMKKSEPIIRVDEGGRTMLLAKNATRKTRDKFENLL
jgi:hypothetical protein